MFCQNTSLIANNNVATKEVGFINLYKLVQSMIKTSNMSIPAELEGYGLEKLSSYTEAELRETIADLKKMFESKYNKTSAQKNKLEYLNIIIDEELQMAQTQLAQIKKILDNQSFTNSIKIIINKNNAGQASEQEIAKYSFYKNLQNQMEYLENIKIGSSKAYENQKKTLAANKVMTKKIVSDGKIVLLKQFEGIEEKSDAEEIVTNWANGEVRRLIEALDDDFMTSMRNSNINLQSKVQDALAKFLDVSMIKAGILMRDADFRMKLFGALNKRDIDNKINIINGELNELTQIKDFLAAEYRRKYTERVFQMPPTSANDATARAPGFEGAGDIRLGSVSINKIKNTTKLSDIRMNIKNEILSQYKQLLTLNIIDNKAYKQIEEITNMEINHMNLNNIMATKSIIRAFTSKVVLSYYINNQDVYTPLESVANTMATIFNNNESKITKYENIFKNIINYENDKPLEIIPSFFANIIDLLKSAQKFTSGKMVQEVQEILHGKTFEHKMAKNIVPTKATGNYERPANTWGSVDNITAPKVTYTTLSSTTKPLDVTSLLMMMSYTQRGNAFAEELQAEMKEQGVELSAQKQDDEPWTWTTKEKYDKIISAIINNESFNYNNIVNELMDIYESSAALSEGAEDLKTTSTMPAKKLEQMKLAFTKISALINGLYQSDVVPHDLYKMKSSKSYEAVKREYFIGLMVNAMMCMFDKLLKETSTLSMKTYLQNAINVLVMFLNKTPVVKSSENNRPRMAAKKVELEINNKDDLLNSFFDEEADDEVYDDKELMDELFGDDE